MTGDAESGVMVMKMDVGLDTGDVAMAERLPITDAMTAQDLHDALAPLGADDRDRADPVVQGPGRCDRGEPLDRVDGAGLEQLGGAARAERREHPDDGDVERTPDLVDRVRRRVETLYEERQTDAGQRAEEHREHEIRCQMRPDGLDRVL